MTEDFYPMNFGGETVKSEYVMEQIRACKKLEPQNVKYIVIHCSATPWGQDLTLEALYNEHVNRRRFIKIGYHYYIRRDGTKYQTRELNEVGAHCKPWNSSSIGVCYEGGLLPNGKPGFTLTDAQEATMRGLLVELQNKFPNARIKGHRDMPGATNKACPCFDAERHFRGILLYDPKTNY